MFVTLKLFHRVRLHRQPSARSPAELLTDDWPVVDGAGRCDVEVGSLGRRGRRRGGGGGGGGGGGDHGGRPDGGGGGGGGIDDGASG